MNDAILNLLIYIIEFNLLSVANLLCVNSRNPLKTLMIKIWLSMCRVEFTPSQPPEMCILNTINNVNFSDVVRYC